MTIPLSNEMKEKLDSIRVEGESYEDVIRRMYEVMCEKLLSVHLYGESDAMSIEETRAFISETKE